LTPLDPEFGVRGYFGILAADGNRLSNDYFHFPFRRRDPPNVFSLVTELPRWLGSREPGLLERR
jgi:hypothetical protein